VIVDAGLRVTAAGGPAATPPIEGVVGPSQSVEAAALREQLVEKYAHLVKYVVGRLAVSVPGVFDREDAMQAGTIGLLRAIDGYRADSAASFESYAIVRIRGAILDAVRVLDGVGRAGREAGRAIGRAIHELEAELGRPPGETEVAARLGVTVERYREQLAVASVVTVSLDEPDPRTDDDEPAGGYAESTMDQSAVDPGEEIARRDAVAVLAREISRLPDRPKLVLALYYQDELTFREIGGILGVTESRVCQIHTEAILTLRNRMVEPDLLARFPRRRVRR
jgi:RNA polymerase sigma factor for flagellar operon FliA